MTTPLNIYMYVWNNFVVIFPTFSLNNHIKNKLVLKSEKQPYQGFVPADYPHIHTHLKNNISDLTNIFLALFVSLTRQARQWEILRHFCGR